MRSALKYGFVAVAVLLLAVLLYDGMRDKSVEVVIEKRSEVPVPVDWGDGSVRKIDASEYKSLVTDFTKPGAAYLGAGPCVVDFYASWCGPCHALAPRLDRLAEIYKGKVQFYKVDVDDNRELASAYGIRSIPTLLFFKNGVMTTYAGAPHNLTDLVDELTHNE